MASEVTWHINVNRTEGKPFNRELFAESKQKFVERNHPLDIIGFYSEKHPGVFISKKAPAIKPDSGASNAIHIHFVSREGKPAVTSTILSLARA